MLSAPDSAMYVSAARKSLSINRLTSSLTHNGKWGSGGRGFRSCRPDSDCFCFYSPVELSPRSRDAALVQLPVVAHGEAMLDS